MAVSYTHLDVYKRQALWTLMPKLEELFYIPKPAVDLGMDFTKAETSVLS